MGLKETGVRFVAEGETRFVGAMERANKAVSNFGAGAQAAVRPLETVSARTIALGTAAGQLAVSAIQKVVSGIADIGRQAIGSAADLQTLTVSLESLTAQQLLSAGQASNMTDALAMAEPVAQGLLDKIEDLALVSPFEYQDVVGIFRLNKAFGQSIDMSLKLTKAITDTAAASGQSSAVMERIAYNFSQMSMTGQVTMRDVRDLALAGVDLSRVLDSELGMSINQVNDALKSGQITMEDVSNAFVGYAEKNFGGAAERMSKTAEGLGSSFKDLMFFSSVDVVGPALERVTTALAGLFDQARGIIDSGALKTVGVGLDMLVEGAMGAGSKLTQTVGQLFSGFGQQADATANDALDWGFNIVQQLATGMIRGVSGAMVAAMDFIGSFLSGWLAPGSPPKVAPNIDTWGAEAMGQYLHGFTEADFSALRSIQGPLQDALQISMQLGQMGAEDAGRIYADISSQLADALASGNMPGQELFDQLAASAGEFGDEIVTLAMQQMELSSATDAVKQSEQALAAARKAEASAGAAVNQQVKEYNDMLRSGAGKEALDAKLKEINLAKEAQLQAVDQRQAAEDAVVAAEDRLGPLQEAARIQEELLRQLLEISRMQITPGTEEETGEGGAITPPPVDIAGLSDKVGASLDDLRAMIEAKVKDLFKPITDEWGAAQERVSEKVKELMGPLQDFMEDASARLSGIGENLRRFWDENGPGISASIQRIVDKASAALGDLAGRVMDWALSKMERFSQWFVDVGPYIDGFISKIADVVSWMMDRLAPAWAFQSPLLDALIEEVLGFGKTLLQVVNGDFSGAWTTMQETATRALNSIYDAADRFGVAFLSMFGIHVDSIFGEAARLGTELGARAREALDNAIVAIGEKWQDFYNAGQQIVQGLIDGINSMISDPAGYLSGLVNDLVTMVKNLLGIQSPSKVFAGIGMNTMLGMAEGIEATQAAPVRAVSGAIQHTLSPAMAMQGAVYNRTLNAPINATINNGMDLAALKMVIGDVIRAEFA